MRGAVLGIFSVRIIGQGAVHISFLPERFSNSLNYLHIFIALKARDNMDSLLAAVT